MRVHTGARRGPDFGQNSRFLGLDRTTRRAGRPSDPCGLRVAPARSRQERRPLRAPQSDCGPKHSVARDDTSGEAIRNQLDKARRRPRRSPLAATRPAGLPCRDPSCLATLRSRRRQWGFSSSSMRAGTISNRSPTTPKSATSKIGAFWSLLMAAMVREPFMPTTCWIAPLMPRAR
jgi:hypothetical protein